MQNALGNHMGNETIIHSMQINKVATSYNKKQLIEQIQNIMKKKAWAPEYYKTQHKH